jgi:hypothetical protein
MFEFTVTKEDSKVSNNCEVSDYIDTQKKTRLATVRSRGHETLSSNNQLHSVQSTKSNKRRGSHCEEIVGTPYA